jgi:flagellar hook-associated protein 1
MSGLLGSLRNAAGAMRVIERGMAVVQANVTNAATPGYARQRQMNQALPFDLDRGLVGGVASVGVATARSLHAEQSVRRLAHATGMADERAIQLASLEPVFSIDGVQGVGAALSRFFQSASSLSVTPNDGAAREQLLEQANRLAGTFHHTAAGLGEGMASLDRSILAQLNDIHAIASQLQQLNARFKQDFRTQHDAGVDAQLNSLLESLASKVDFTALRAADGSVTILAGGQTPLLIGERLYGLTAAPAAGGGLALFDYDGRDVTEQIQGGSLAALLELRNETLPGYLQSLNRLAERFATEVNAVLSGGVDQNGNPPALDLFTFDAGAGAARTIRLTGISAAELALASPSAPGGNGNALALAALETQRLVDGVTFVQAYGNLAGRMGRDLSSARNESTVQRQLFAQAREMRDEISRVNLDEEAIALMEFQRAYQATARVVQAVDEMLDAMMRMLR